MLESSINFRLSRTARTSKSQFSLPSTRYSIPTLVNSQESFKETKFSIPIPESKESIVQRRKQARKAIATFICKRKRDEINQNYNLIYLQTTTFGREARDPHKRKVIDEFLSSLQSLKNEYRIRSTPLREQFKKIYREIGVNNEKLDLLFDSDLVSPLTLPFDQIRNLILGISMIKVSDLVLSKQEVAEILGYREVDDEFVHDFRKFVEGVKKKAEALEQMRFDGYRRTAERSITNIASLNRELSQKRLSLDTVGFVRNVKALRFKLKGKIQFLSQDLRANGQPSEPFSVPKSTSDPFFEQAVSCNGKLKCFFTELRRKMEEC